VEEKFSIEKDRRIGGCDRRAESGAEMVEVQPQALWWLIEFFKTDAVTAGLIGRGGAIFATG